MISRITGKWAANWVNELRFNWEALSNRWNQLVLNYSPDRQRETLERLGMKTPGWQDMVIAMVIGLSLIALAVTGWMLRVVRERDPVERAWMAFCKRLARAGAARAPYEGPLDYGKRAADLLQRERHAPYRRASKPSRAAMRCCATGRNRIECGSSSSPNSCGISVFETHLRPRRAGPSGQRNVPGSGRIGPRRSGRA